MGMLERFGLFRLGWKRRSMMLLDAAGCPWWIIKRRCPTSDCWGTLLIALTGGEEIEDTWTAEEHNRYVRALTVTELARSQAKKIDKSPDKVYKEFIDLLNGQKKLTPQEIDRMNEFMEWYRQREISE